MPELPEVETIARDLNEALRGLTIKDFKVINEKTRRIRPFLSTTEKKLRQAVIGRKIVKISRRAKMLVFNLDDNLPYAKKNSEGVYLLAHLKMTGQLILIKPRGQSVIGGHPIVSAEPELPNKFTRAIMTFSDNSFLYFNDIRRFGWLKIFNFEELKNELSSFGIEPLSKEFTANKLKQILKHRAKTTIKQAIMDQKLLAGIGNIYADECLFAAKIKPQRRAGTLKPAEIVKLHNAIRKILRFSIAKRGTTLSDYRDGHGLPGGFVRFLKVYGRAGKPCKICGRPVNKGRLGGRSTHWCSVCQK